MKNALNYPAGGQGKCTKCFACPLRCEASKNWVHYFLSSPFLVMSLYACIVDVAIMAFIKDNLWCALFLYEMLWYIFLILFSYFLFFPPSCDSISVCDFHYAPKWLQSWTLSLPAWLWKWSYRGEGEIIQSSYIRS